MRYYIHSPVNMQKRSMQTRDNKKLSVIDKCMSVYTQANAAYTYCVSTLLGTSDVSVYLSRLDWYHLVHDKILPQLAQSPKIILCTRQSFNNKYRIWCLGVFVYQFLCFSDKWTHLNSRVFIQYVDATLDLDYIYTYTH